MDYHVRTAKMEDLQTVLDIYAYARSFMAAHGNPNQWKNTHPAEEILREDIALQRLYVLESGEKIHGVFFFRMGDDPTYSHIDGSWRSSRPYGVIHRIAGDGSGGVLRAAVEYGKQFADHLRIDTHADNAVMQNALKKQGFSHRGTIYLENGEPRLAYDWILT